MAAHTRSPRPAPIDPVLDFMRLVWAVEHRLERTSKRMAADLGVTGPQRLVLRIVERWPDISPGQLAGVAQLHPSTVTGVIRRLEHKRLLGRTIDPADSRRAQLRVRPGARRLTRQAGGTVEAAVTAVLRALPARTLSHGREVLAALAAALDDHADRGRPRARGVSAARPGH